MYRSWTVKNPQLILWNVNISTNPGANSTDLIYTGERTKEVRQNHDRESTGTPTPCDWIKGFSNVLSYNIKQRYFSSHRHGPFLSCHCRQTVSTITKMLIWCILHESKKLRPIVYEDYVITAHTRVDKIHLFWIVDDPFYCYSDGG